MRLTLVLALAALTILLLPVTGRTLAQGKPEPPAGVWLVEDIEGRGVVDRVRTTVEFAGADKVAGSTGCNRYHGTVTREGGGLRLGLLAMTRMACPPAVMDQETRFVSAAAKVRGWRTQGPLLILTGERGEALLRLSPL